LLQEQKPHVREYELLLQVIMDIKSFMLCLKNTNDMLLAKPLNILWYTYRCMMITVAWSEANFLTYI
jgi:hypothetical protein